MNKQLIYGGDAQKALSKGVDIVSNAVKVTLGPRGRNVVIFNENGGDPIITKDGVTVAKSIEVEEPFENLGAQLCKQVSQKTNDIAGDGPQPLYSEVLTPTGFVKMGDIKKGDIICGSKGTHQYVKNIYPKGEKEIVEVKFTDGRIVECCEDHLWTVINTRGIKQTLTTKELMRRGVTKINKLGHLRHKFFIERSIAEFTKQQVPLEPYLVGLLIGDGSLSSKGDIELSLGPNDQEVINKIVLPEGLFLKIKYVEHKNHYRVKIKGKTNDNKNIHQLIEEIGLLNKNSHNKFIPHQYLYSDINSRRALLDGLIDTGGHINKRGLLEYSTVSEQLAKDVQSLLRSLGKATYFHLQSRATDSSYSDNPIYRIYELKGDKYGISIDSITPTLKHTEMQCIKVSNNDNLYFTNDYIMTHNTTTATVLAQAIVTEGLRYVLAGGNPLSIKRGLDKGLTVALDAVRDRAKEISDKTEIEFIASISGNDPEVGSVVADAIEAVGEDGIITLEESTSRETYFELVEGFSYNQGYVSPYMINNVAKSSVEYKNVNIFLFDGALNEFDGLVKLLESRPKSSPLLIIAESFSQSILQALVINKVQGGLPWVATKTPGFGEQKKDYIQDICAKVGGEVFRPDLGHKYENAKLGFAASVVITKDNTTIIEGKSNQEMLNERIALVKSLLDVEESKYNREKLTERLGKLRDGIGLIKVGASTDIEVKEKKYRYEDALSATRAAIEEGVVPGGGVCLLKLSKFVEENTLLDVKDDSEAMGLKILCSAMRAPFNQICINAGFSSELMASQVMDGDFALGLDAKYGEVCNLIERGVIDPAKVTRAALTNAVSIASLVLTTETLIAPVIENKEKILVSEAMY